MDVAATNHVLTAAAGSFPYSRPTAALGTAHRPPRRLSPVRVLRGFPLLLPDLE